MKTLLQLFDIYLFYNTKKYYNNYNEFLKI